MSVDPLVDYSLRIALIVAMGVVSYKVEAVDKRGLLTGYIIGSAILMLGGWGMFILIAYFFAAASLATKYKYEFKRSRGVAEDKRGARSAGNVLGNGLAAMVFAILEFMFGGEAWALAYIGAVAMVTSDTLATEIGLLYPKPPRLITNPLRSVEPGYSGGVTPLGYLTITVASASVGLIGWLFRLVPDYTLVEVVVAAVAGGLIGSTVDSIIGATIQAQYRCRVCGKLTEKRVHCGADTLHVKGYHIVDNHVVNLLGSIAGAATTLAVALYLI